MSAPITFVIPGGNADRRRARAMALPSGARLKASVTVTAQRGAGSTTIRTDAVPGEDVVVVDIAGGPSLWLHPESARDLMDSQHDPRLGRGAAPLDAGAVRVPARLSWRLDQSLAVAGARRGMLGDVGVEAVHVITKFVEDKAAEFVASKVVQAFDALVDPGLYQLRPDTIAQLKGSPRSVIADGDSPSLVLIHGAFSHTAGSFGKLWTEHPQRVDQIFQRFQNRVYGLDHPTLGASPIANAITLAEAAPNGARLHLLSHSRGGLVAEVLARICANPRAADLDLFRDDRSSAIELKRLAELVADKQIAIERVVRVACPARGTLLASKRLDAYVSVLKWALELAQIPVAPQLVDFLGEVARRRADPEQVPGLAALLPDAPLIRWLHAAQDPIKGDLRVVAGDLQGDSVVSWVKALLSDAFFWTDNDLIVQTRSMYGGSPREKDSVFLLDQGGRVSHFNYFSNPRTASAVVNALTTDGDAPPDGFRPIGPLSFAGKSPAGVRAALPSRPAAKAAELPALFILPGILGSHLKIGDERVWLDRRLVNSFDRLAYDPKRTDVTPDGPVGMYYDDLTTALSQDHEVKPFAFDWRLPILAEARRLAAEIATALDARKTSRQPLRILAHSSGGLLARALRIVDPETWDRMMTSDGARILMLGTPNGGCWTPMRVLSGDDTLGNLLINVGTPFSGQASRQLFADFPGFIQLQAGLLSELGREKTWQDLATSDREAIRARSQWHSLPIQLAQFEWGIPSQAVLDEAAKFHRALDQQRDNDLAAFAHQWLLVVGQAARTPAGYDPLNGNQRAVVYLDAADAGDGRVTLDSAMLPGVATFAVDADHGSLPRYRAAFEGYRELLNTGSTSKLRQIFAGGIARGPAAALGGPVARSRPARQSSPPSPPPSELEVLSSGPELAPGPIPQAASLRISFENGDLTYISDPLLIGHYRSSRLSGAEAVMDRALNGAMSASLRRGLYPTGPGTNQAFLNVTANPDNPWQPPRPAAVIVAGLGPEGELRGSDLVHSIRQAVIGWAQHLTESHPVPTGFTLATTLLGSGGCGITAGQAAQLIAQGVREANQQLALGGARPPWPRVDRLKIIELYLDRANEAWNALQALAASSPELYAIDPMIAPGTGALRRPAEAGYRGADYDFISAFVINTEDDTDQIGYTINSKRARNEVRTQPMQIRLISNLVKTASDHTDTDTEIGRTLFTLLVPADLEAFLGGRTETVLELDDATSAIPWEILESPTSSDQNAPWSIRTKLLRKLRTATPTLAVNSATADDGILVIGDPACDRNQYPVLWGARQEAAEVAKCLTAAIAGVPDREGSGGARVTAVISGPNAGDPEPDAATVINQVVPKSWRIIHVAGHGEPPITDGKRTDTRGVVLSGGLFLGAQEIAALRVKPELVFVNCCHLAADDPNPQFKPTNYDRVQFASGVAHALIKGGVRCVVAAGWAVDDDAASVFATAFYQALLAGARFIDAVAAAREKAYGCGGNTWAAYQCYGDPDWQFTAANADAQRPRASPGQEFAGIASAPSLVLALERIAVESEYQGRPSDLQAERLGHLETTFGHYLDRGDVAAAFGNAWSKSGRFAKALDWYERARLAQDGTASLVAIEQLANLRIRQAWNSIKDDSAPPATAINQAREAIRTASELLDTMLALAPTYERESIRGSGFKRLAMLEAKAGRPDQETTAIKEMYKHYSAAETMARKTPAHPFFYPAMNRIAAQLALFDGAKPLDQTEIKALQESMSSVPPDFWSVVGQTELELFVSVSDGRLSEAVDRLIKGFREHYLRVSNPRMWGSVLDNATFVLSRYRRRAKPSEATAADRLIGELKARANGLTFAAPEDGIGTTTTPRPRPEAGEARSTIGRHRGSGPARRAGSSKGGR